MMCVIYKWIMSFNITEERQLPRYLQRHLKRCAACRAYYDDSIRLTESLRSQAAAGLHIITASDINPQSSKRPLLPVWLKTAALIAIVIGAFAAFNSSRFTGPSQKQLECFDLATDMLFDSPALKYTILTGSVEPSRLDEQYKGLPEILSQAVSLLMGNLSTGLEDKPADSI